MRRLLTLLMVIALTVPLMGQARIYQSGALWKVSLTVVEAVTTTRVTAAIDDGMVFTNTGDADGAAITLMNDPVAGLTHRMLITAAQTLTISPSSGETVYLNGVACVGTPASSSTIGSSATFIASSAGSGAIWIALATGTWACAP
jgi:hypothetical protein